MYIHIFIFAMPVREQCIQKQRWWDAQFIALDCFRRRNIPVEVVRVESNFVDGSGPLVAITQTSYVEKYANAADSMT